MHSRRMVQGVLAGCGGGGVGGPSRVCVGAAVLPSTQGTTQPYSTRALPLSIQQHYRKVLWTREEARVVPHPSGRPQVYDKLRARLLQAAKQQAQPQEGTNAAPAPILPPSRVPVPEDQVANMSRAVQAVAQGEFPLARTYPTTERGRDALIARLRAEHPEGAGLHAYAHPMLHVEYTRFLRVCDELRGLSCDQAMLQLRWHTGPIGERTREALVQAMLRAREEGGLHLEKTYIADVFVRENAASLSTTFARRYIRGRARYGATPHFKSAVLDVLLQERERPFAKRQQDPLEWLRERLRQARAGGEEGAVGLAARAVDEYRAHHPRKQVHC